jgi:transcriptional regulator with XRE-family HTH domain
MSADDEIQEEEKIIPQDPVIAAIRELLESPDCPPLSKEVLDVLYPPGKPLTEEEIVHMRLSLLERKFVDLHPQLVRRLMKPVQISTYLKETRESANIQVMEVTRVIGWRPAYLEKIESGETPFWQIPGLEAAKLFKLYRTHSEGVRQLVLATIAVTKGREEMREEIERAEPDLRKELEAESTDEIEEFTDEFYAGMADEGQMTGVGEKWLRDVTEGFVQLGAIDYIE